MSGGPTSEAKMNAYFAAMRRAIDESARLRAELDAKLIEMLREPQWVLVLPLELEDQDPPIRLL